MQYAFADTDVAERRLALVAETFAPATTAFLHDVAPQARALAVDLGCGPGHTTRLLASVLGCTRTVGLDGSARFIAAARAAGGDSVEFIEHDVTALPFPTPPADLVYCRFLLSHLREPAAALARWATQLAPAGLLLVEEVETIDTTLTVFRRYLRIVDEVLTAAGGELYVGPTLAAVPDTGPLRRRTSRVAPIRVANRKAAAMFALNIPAWRDHAYVRAHYGMKTLARIADELAAVAAAPGDVSDITWGLRQLVLADA